MSNKTETNIKLSELDMLESLAKQETSTQHDVEDTMQESAVEEEENVVEMPSIIDGYKILNRDTIPFQGKFYPKSWSFAYRCPVSVEVANFSTINEKDQPAIMSAIEDLICKCVVIIDTETGKQISSRQINDGDRMFFFLLLRDFYLPGFPISYTTMCMFCKSPVEVAITAESLRYKMPSQKIMDSFDGRKFSLDMGLKQNISFLMPTLEISSKIFRYITKVYKNESSDNSKETEAFNKQFLLIAPFLYESGREPIEALKNKFRNIKSNGEMLNAYVTIANLLKLDNLETIAYQHDCGSEEEAAIRFPDGWKKMFISKGAYNGMFE